MTKKYAPGDVVTIDKCGVQTVRIISDIDVLYEVYGGDIRKVDYHVQTDSGKIIGVSSDQIING